MKIEKIEIYGYGKFINQSFTLSEDLNLFVGKNGSGKSTLASFVKSIMFGFPSQRKQGYRQYDTNQQAVYGGKLTLMATPLGNNVTIERTKYGNRQEKFITIDDQERREVQDFSELFKDITRQDYSTYFGFCEQDLMSFVWKNEEDFAKSLISIGTSGKEALLNKVVPEVKKEADRIYLPNGQKPKLNQQLNGIEEHQKILEKASQTEQDYFRMKTEWVSNNTTFEQLSKERNVLNEQLVKLHIAANQEDAVMERMAISNELAEYTFKGITEEEELEWRNLSDDFVREQAKLEKKNRVEPEISNANRSLTAGMEWIHHHHQQSEGMIQEARKFHQKWQADETLRNQIGEKRYELNGLLNVLGAESIHDLPTPLTEEERENCKDRQHEIDNQRVFYENAKNSLNQLTQEKRQLLEEQQEIENEYQSFQVEEVGEVKPHLRTMGLIVLVIGIVLFFVNFVLHFGSVIQLVAFAVVIIGILMTLVGIISYSRDKRYIDDEIVAYKTDLTDIASELSEVQRQIDNQQEQMNHLEAQSKQFVDDLKQLVVDKGGSPTVQPLIWIQNDYDIQARQLNEEINQLLKSDFDVASEDVIDEKWQSYGEVIGQSQFATDILYQNFEDDYNNYKQYMAENAYSQHEADAWNSRMSMIQEQIETIQRRRQQIAEKYHCETPEAFERVLDKEVKMKDKQRRFDWLSHNIDVEIADEIGANASEALASVEGQLSQTEVLMQDITNKNAQLKADMDKLTSSDELQRLTQIHQDRIDEAYQSTVAWASDQIVSQLLEEASMGGEADSLHRALNQASRYLYDLSEGRFEKIAYYENRLEVYASYQEDWVSLYQLSQGEKSLLFIAMRFAFLDAQLSSVRLPIMIDDAFIHVDNDYRQNIYRFLSERSQNYQIIYMTYDESIAEYFPHTNLIHLQQND